MCTPHNDDKSLIDKFKINGNISILIPGTVTFGQHLLLKDATNKGKVFMLLNKPSFIT